MRVLVVAGASGGHIFPAVGFLERLRLLDVSCQALLLVPEHTPVKLEGDLSFSVRYLPRIYFSRKSAKALFNGLVSGVKNFFKSVEVILGFKPDVVVGFGSIASIPVVLIAWFLRIKTIIHEQNVIPGRANRLLALFVDKIAISFKETADYLISQRRKVVLTGNPLRLGLRRLDKRQACEYFGFSPEQLTFLIMGGSQGSKKLNFVCLDYFKSLPPLGSNLQILHLAGRRDFEQIQNEYKRLGIKARVFAFLEEMDYAYSACDLIIARAGATTITEILYYGIPAILVPYPYAYQHQMANARVLEQKGVAVIIEERNLNASTLKEALDKLQDGLFGRENIYQTCRQMYFHDAAERFCQEVLALN